MTLVARCLLVLFALTGGGESPTGNGAKALIARIRVAGPLERPALVQQLSLAGPGALRGTREARDAAPPGELKAAFAKAARWQLARKVTPVLLEGYLTQLTFAGQYVKLLEEGPELAPALVALMDDTATDARVRLSACRALADAVDSKLERPGGKGPLLADDKQGALLTSLRRIYHDVLLAAFLREQVGVLLAVLGDTQAVESELRRLEKLASSEELIESTQSHLQLSNLYYRIRDYEKAIKSYEEVLAFYEQILDARRSRGAAKEALESWNRELALHYYNAACSNSLNRDVETAKTLLRKAVELDPSHAAHVDQDGDLLNVRDAPGYAEFRKELRLLRE